MAQSKPKKNAAHFYSLLEVDVSSSTEDIKKAYRKQALVRLPGAHASKHLSVFPAAVVVVLQPAAGFVCVVRARHDSPPTEMAPRQKSRKRRSDSYVPAHQRSVRRLGAWLLLAALRVLHLSLAYH